MLRIAIPVFVAAIALAGCSPLTANWRVNDIQVNQISDDRKSDGKIDLDWEISQVSDCASRNELIAKLLSRSDQVCEQHEGDIIATGSVVNLNTSLLATALSGLGAIASGVAARNLSAGSTIVSAGKDQYNSNVYYGFITPAIVREIKKDRSEKLTNIKSHFKDDLRAYPVSEAISDALQYHYSCSFYNGLVLLTQDKAKYVASYSDLALRIKNLDDREAVLSSTITKADSSAQVLLTQELNALRATRAILVEQQLAAASRP